ncbi:IscS subfamily cysteine desulfurase [Dyella nitratireducens]|uniref:cysteine desulfurase n=2 Tax=Dyella nitratireducens TaxID=1849580 RepID=A0ABQ1GWF4_9GAMM|nr:IscS subfamily cysteine desulfurase [Dyella nitratireducens]GLQ41696.1 IscS subfamily cysteine desulfurase [Dyella nitratireducens]
MGMQASARRIYLDHNATTPLDPRVLDAMLPFFTKDFGNAASTSHPFGWQARSAVEEARVGIAQAIHAAPDHEIVFTSGATESINLALKGLQPEHGKNHVVTSQIEHKAVLDSCWYLEQNGVNVTYVGVDEAGRVDLDQLASAINDRTYLVSIMLANNETGIVQDMAAIAGLCLAKGVVLHTDATQALGKIDVDMNGLDIGLASFSGHKLYGPKGVGALYVRGDLLHRMQPQLHGGGHENGLRSGTLNVPGIVGFAAALNLCIQAQPSESLRMASLRKQLHEAVTSQLTSVRLNGDLRHALPGTLNLSFAQTDADSILLEMPDIALSSGSACTSAKVEPSHVLKAMGVSDELARASIRFGIGRFNTEEEIAYAARRCIEAVKRLRAMSPLTV